MSDENEVVIVTKELIKADVVDASGDYFPRAVLEEMAREANARIAVGRDIWVQENFGRDIVGIQARVRSVQLNEQGDALNATIELMPTPKGKACASLLKADINSLELAMGGRLNPETDITVVERDGVKVQEIQKVEMTNASLVQKGTKVK